jgi:hypothetical protein
MEYRNNLFDYIKWRGDLSFKQSSFNKIDGMILSRFSYVPFGLVIPKKDKQFYRLGDLADRLCHYPDIENSVLKAEDTELLRLLGASSRFRDLQIGNYVDLYDAKDEVQFSAITIQFPDGVHGIAFRGTDDTLVGWKEDMKMGFVFPIASQCHAKNYLEELANKTSDRLVLMGHSKGGNLAAYAAAFCDRRIQERIRTVYNYDGPGFHDGVLESEEYSHICRKIHTFVPQSSVVGMLLGHREAHRVVRSNEVGPFQHNVYSWEVQGKEFLYEQELTKGSRFLDRTMKNWLAGMDQEQRELFVEAVFSIVSDTNAKTLRDMKNDWRGNSQQIFKSMKNMDEGTKRTIRDGIALFMKSARTP